MKKMILLMVLLVMLQTASAFEISVSKYDPTPAEAGKPVNIWLAVENPRIDSEDAGFIEIRPKDGLMLSTGQEANESIGIMLGRSTYEVQYRLLVKPDAFEGRHLIEVRQHLGSVIASSNLFIQVTEKDVKEVDLAIGDVESTPTRIKPDDKNVQLDVTVQNLGDGTARGIRATLVDLPQGIALAESYSGSALVGNVPADSVGAATFYLDVDERTEPGEHQAALALTYKYKPYDDEEDYIVDEVTLPLSISVMPVPLYEIIKMELDPGVLRAGQKDVTLRLTIKNVGQEEGESVRIKAYGKTEQPITFTDSSDFIAPSLKPGEIGQATLEFDIEPDAPLQKYYLDLEIKNVVNDDVVTYNKKVAVLVTEPRPNNPWPMLYVGGAVVLVVLIYLWIAARRRTKTEPKKVSGHYKESYLKRRKNG